MKYDVILVVHDTSISVTQTLPGLYLSEARVRVITIDAVMLSGVTLINNNGATSASYDYTHTWQVHSE